MEMLPPLPPSSCDATLGGLYPGSAPSLQIIAVMACVLLMAAGEEGICSAVQVQHLQNGFQTIVRRDFN